MIKKTLSLTLLFITLSLHSSSQKRNFIPGYYIYSGSKDTVQGYISVDKKKTITSIAFKETAAEKETKIIPIDSCKSFSVGTDLYFIIVVSRNMTHIDKFTYEITLPDSNITEAIPLKLLYNGNILSLYYYKDVKDHFFMYDGKKMQELVVSYRYLTESDKLKLKLYNIPKYFIDKDYFRQIGAALNYQITERQWYLIQETEYEEKPLIKLFKNLNNEKRK